MLRCVYISELIAEALPLHLTDDLKEELFRAEVHGSNHRPVVKVGRDEAWEECWTQLQPQMRCGWQACRLSPVLRRWYISAVAEKAVRVLLMGESEVELCQTEVLET